MYSGLIMVSRFLRNSAGSTNTLTTTAPSTHNGQNGVQRNEMRTAPTSAANRNAIELQSVVTTCMSKNCETRVTTALLPSEAVENGEAGSACSAPCKNGNGGNVVTVVEINGGGRDFCKIIKDSEKASPVLDSSVHCEECCRSCSCCGETVYSSAEDSIIIDEVQALVSVGDAKEVSKTTISTQTSLTDSVNK